MSAGADILTAATFRTNPRTLRQAGLEDRGAELNRLAVKITRRAAGDAQVLIAASVAPVEDCYRPDLLPPPDALRAEHAQMMTWLRDAAPDFVLLETMNSAAEALLAAQTARDANLPFAVSFVTREDGALLSGESLAEAVAQLEALAPLAVGVNCIPPSGVSERLRALRPLTPRPLLAYGHINNTYPTPGWHYAEAMPPQDYAAFAADWVAQGARIIGGCCGTTPAHIGALRGLIPRTAR